MMTVYCCIRSWQMRGNIQVIVYIMYNVTKVNYVLFSLSPTSEDCRQNTIYCIRFNIHGVKLSQIVFLFIVAIFAFLFSQLQGLSLAHYQPSVNNFVG